MSTLYREYFLNRYSVDIEVLSDYELKEFLHKIIKRNDKIISLQIVKNNLLKGKNRNN